jgi:hypothetical protein
MTTQPMLPFTAQRIRQRRDSKRAQIEAFFGDNIGIRISSRKLHGRWGSAVRTRISNINDDEFSSIRILNEVIPQRDGSESSWYWAILK